MKEEIKDFAFIINGKKYEYLKSKCGSVTQTCGECALREKCKDYDDGVICAAFGLETDSRSNFQLAEDATIFKEPEYITEQKAYETYQERSHAANDRGEQLAWAFIVMLTGMLIAGHGWLEFYVGAACGLAYLLLSMLQATWQTIAIWIIKNRIKMHDLKIEDYPQWVGGWAWVFYYLKIALLAIGTIYVASRFVTPLFR